MAVMRQIPTSLLFILVSLLFSVSANAQSDDIEVTDSTSTGWDDGTGGGGLNPQEPTDPVTSLTLSQTSLILDGGERVRLVATVNQRAKNKNIIWTSANSTIASVDANGTVMGLAKGQTTVTATAEGNTSLKKTCTVTVISTYEGMFLPDVPFEFCYNAFDYNETTHSIPNHPQANLSGYSLQLTENLPQLVNKELLRIDDRCEGYIDRWDKWSNESGAYFYRGGQDCMTIVAKVAPRLGRGNSCDLVANRGNGYNYMWRIGEGDVSFLHTNYPYDDERTLPLASERPQILAVRVDGVNDYILLQNLTTGESRHINSVGWGGGDNVFKLFFNNAGEYWLGDFYWVYYSFELLTDQQMAIFTSTPLKGDVNGDGKVDIADVIAVSNYMAGKTVVGLQAADVTGDGKVTPADIATLLLRIVKRK